MKDPKECQSLWHNYKHKSQWVWECKDCWDIDDISKSRVNLKLK